MSAEIIGRPPAIGALTREELDREIGSWREEKFGYAGAEA